MKKAYLVAIVSILALTLNAQADRSDILTNLEQNKQTSVTATLKSSSRLFGAKDDLTTVILIIPSGSKVSVLGSDSTYLHVTYEEYEGYIFSRHAVVDKIPARTIQPDQSGLKQAVKEPAQQQQVSRFTYLENKYGSNMAARINAGRIWKGMSAEMVNDSWGTAQKINRSISGNIIKEEWIYRNTWLYFENNTLLDWGPIQR